MKSTALRSLLHVTETLRVPGVSPLSDLTSLYPNEAVLYLPTLPILALYERRSQVTPDQYLPEHFRALSKGPLPLLEQLGRIRQSQLIVPAPGDQSVVTCRGPQQFTLSPAGEVIMGNLRAALKTRYREERACWHRLYEALTAEFNQVTVPMLIVTLGVQQGWVTRSCLTELLHDTPLRQIDDTLRGAVSEGLLTVQVSHGLLGNLFPVRTYELTYSGHRLLALARDL